MTSAKCTDESNRLAGKGKGHRPSGVADIGDHPHAADRKASSEPFGPPSALSSRILRCQFLPSSPAIQGTEAQGAEVASVLAQTFVIGTCEKNIKSATFQEDSSDGTSTSGNEATGFYVVHLVLSRCDQRRRDVEIRTKPVPARMRRTKSCSVLCSRPHFTSHSRCNLH